METVLKQKMVFPHTITYQCTQLFIHTFNTYSQATQVRGLH
jgi:hypothetical protein